MLSILGKKQIILLESVFVNLTSSLGLGINSFGLEVSDTLGIEPPH